MLHRPDPELVELEAALQRTYGLSTRDQLALYSTLHDYLVAQAGIPAGQPPVIQERIYALDVMREVANHIGLPEGASPKTTEFTDAVRELGLSGWNVTRVGNAFRKSYKLARVVYEGGKMPETAEQAALRRQTAGRKRSHETYLTGVRQFLDWLLMQPPPACDDDGPHNYNSYVDAHNRRVLAQSPDGPLLVKSRSACQALGLSWELVLAVARHELSYDKTRKRHLAAWGDKEGPLRLISSASVARVLGVSTAMVQLMRLRGELPPVAVRLNRRGAAAWLRDDIEALAAGGPVPDRVEGWMQNDLVLLAELAERLGKTAGAVRTAVHAGRDTVVPTPSDGRVGGVHYWMRHRIDSWLAARE